MAFNTHRQHRPLDLSGIEQYAPNIQLVDQVLANYQTGYDATEAALTKGFNFKDADAETARAYKQGLAEAKENIVQSYMANPRRGAAASRDTRMQLSRDWQPGGVPYELSQAHEQLKLEQAAIQQSDLDSELKRVLYDKRANRPTFGPNGEMSPDDPFFVPKGFNFIDFADEKVSNIVPESWSNLKEVYEGVGAERELVGYETSNGEKVTVDRIGEVYDMAVAGDTDAIDMRNAFGDTINDRIDKGREYAQEKFRKFLNKKSFQNASRARRSASKKKSLADVYTSPFKTSTLVASDDLNNVEGLEGISFFTGDKDLEHARAKYNNAEEITIKELNEEADLIGGNVVLERDDETGRVRFVLEGVNNADLEGENIKRYDRLKRQMVKSENNLQFASNNIKTAENVINGYQALLPEDLKELIAADVELRKTKLPYTNMQGEDQGKSIRAYEIKKLNQYLDTGLEQGWVKPAEAKEIRQKIEEANEFLEHQEEAITYNIVGYQLDKTVKSKIHGQTGDRQVEVLRDWLGGQVTANATIIEDLQSGIEVDDEIRTNLIEFLGSDSFDRAGFHYSFMGDLKSGKGIIIITNAQYKKKDSDEWTLVNKEGRPIEIQIDNATNQNIAMMLGLTRDAQLINKGQAHQEELSLTGRSQYEFNGTPIALTKMNRQNSSTSVRTQIEGVEITARDAIEMLTKVQILEDAKVAYQELQTDADFKNDLKERGQTAEEFLTENLKMSFDNVESVLNHIIKK